MTRARVAVRTTTWIGGLVAALVGLVATGDRLAPPPWPVPDPAPTWTWLQRTEPALATFSILRLVAIVVVAYLLVSTLVVLGARARRAPVLVAAASRGTVPAARRLVQHMTGVGLVVVLAGTAGPSVAGATAPAARPVAAPAPFAPAPFAPLRVDPVPVPSPPAATTTEAPAPAPVPPPVLRALPDDPTLVHLGATPSTTPSRATPPSPEPGPAGRSPGATTPTTGAPGAPSETTASSAPKTDPAVTPPPTDPTDPASPGPPPPTTLPPPTTRPPSPPPPPTTPTVPTAPSAPSAPRTTTDPVDPPAPPGARPAPGPMVALPAEDPTPSEPEPAAAPDAALERRHHTIVAGDHLWGVAERTLTDRTGAPPTPAEVVSYLDQLVAANRGVLAVPDNPDLVFPGQVFVLPA